MVAEPGARIGLVARADWPTFGRDVPDAAWRPGPEQLTHSRLSGFLRATALADLEALQRRAESDPAWFWGAAADDIGIAWQRRPTSVLDTSRGIEWSRWWTGGAFNYAAAAIDARADRDPAGEAVAWEGEDGEVRRLTNAELRTQVERAAAAFMALGVGQGDRVGIYLPMLIETVVAVLALGLIRAIYTPIFSGYGAAAVASRLRDCEASLLVTADGFRRRGSIVPLKATADAAVAGAPTVRRGVVVRRLRDAIETRWPAGRDMWWDDALASATVRGEPQRPLTDPETPYMIIYTSGTTGRPKGAV